MAALYKITDRICRAYEVRDHTAMVAAIKDLAHATNYERRKIKRMRYAQSLARSMDEGN